MKFLSVGLILHLNSMHLLLFMVKVLIVSVCRSRMIRRVEIFTISPMMRRECGCLLAILLVWTVMRILKLVRSRVEFIW